MMIDRTTMPPPRRQRLRQRIERLPLLLGLLLISQQSATAEPQLCPNTATTEFGYTSIADINADISSELARIQNGATPNGMYTYSLCGNTVLDASAGPLRPGLSNSFFVCGPNGRPSNNCTISGGEVQVEIDDSLLTDYMLGEVTFLGMQFSGFTGQSVAATASFPTQVNFRDVVWKDFTSDFVIQQMVDGTEAPPMTVDISGATVQDGTAGAIFDNDGGSLRIQNLEVTGVTAPALIATSNGGNSFFQDSSVSASRLDYVTDTSATGAQSVINVQVRDMLSMVNAFGVQDAGSQLSVTGSTVADNQIAGSRWTGVQAQNGATARVVDLTMTGNEGVAFVFSAAGPNSVVQVSDSVIQQNVGTAGPRFISAPGVALSQGTLTVSETQFNTNNGFSGAILALQGSTINMNTLCFTDSQSEYLVFVDRRSNYTQSDNFVSNYSTERCATESGRLFREDPGSGCFEGSSVCNGDCLMMANATVCLAQTTPTAAPATPTSLPTATPTGTPTATPTNVQGVPSNLPTSELTTEPVPTQRPSLPRTETPVPSAITNITAQPTSGAPTVSPGIDTSIPVTVSPSSQPSIQPTRTQTESPGIDTSIPMTVSPSRQPSIQPTKIQTESPGVDTNVPITVSPSRQPSAQPSNLETGFPNIDTNLPTTKVLTKQPSRVPTARPGIETNVPTTAVLTQPPFATGLPFPSPDTTMLPTTMGPEPAPTRKPISATVSPTACPGSLKGIKGSKATKGGGKGKGGSQSVLDHELCLSSPKQSKSKDSKTSGKGGSWSGSYSSGSGPVVYASGSGSSWSGSGARRNRELRIESDSLSRQWRFRHQHSQR